RASEWGIPAGLPVRRLSACTLGVVGFGRIGEAVARRGAALGMRVLAYDPVRPPEEIESAGATPAGFEEVLAAADFLTLHAPPPEGGPLVGAAALPLLPPRAILLTPPPPGLA